MSISFVQGIDKIRQSNKPISTAWGLSCQHLNLDNKINKIIEIIGDHENLFVNRNPYHNQYHLAEVIWASSWLCFNEFEAEVLEEHAIVLFLAATFHDAEHPGRGNRVPFEIEKVSCNFFQQWWKNNSLFIENIMDLSPSQIESAVIELILFTDMFDGNQKVNVDYITRKNQENFGLRIVKLKKVLNEADFLMGVLPQYAIDKTGLLLKESGLIMTDREITNMLTNYLESVLQNEFSDGSKKLKIPQMVDCFVKEVKDCVKNGLNLTQTQEHLYSVFGK